MAENNQLLDKKRILVIGCGPAGSQFAAAAAKVKDYKVTVLTPFNYMEVSLNMTKVLGAGPEEHVKCLHPLLKEDGVEYVIGRCVTLDNDHAILDDGQTLPFDACVVAVGQRIPLFYPNPETDRTIEERKATIANYYQKLLAAQHIVISGGGPVGVETAADIKIRHKDKHVSIVHSHEEVLAAMSDKFRLLAQSQLEKIGVELILSDRVVSNAEKQVTLASGKTIECDVYIPCFPTGGNAAAFLPKESLNPRGYAMVDDTFQVKGLSKVFALGDCSDYDSVKTYPKIQDQLPVLLKNIGLRFQNKDLQHHVKGASFFGKLNGPLLVALGHGAGPESYGVGPDLPGCFLPFCCWFCCCVGPPCSTPAGSGAGKMKSDFNDSVVPKKGKGISS